ncbi:MAG TPA: hypothetical protein VK447_02290 [Myxococcaceae bacterium]|nr:hypothetical protein [Myxococcaceae bacterium]
MVQRESLPEGVTRFKGKMGEALFSTPAPAVALVRYKGHADEALYEPISGEMNALLQRVPKVTLFVDFAECGSYDTDFRARWTEWFRANAPKLVGSHILQKSALVKMGIQLVNLIIGQVLTPVTDPAEFERQLEAATRAGR